MGDNRGRNRVRKRMGKQTERLKYRKDRQTDRVEGGKQT